MQMSLKAARVNRNLTQQELADRLNVNKKTVCAWEQYKSFPDADKVVAICEILNTPIGDIDWAG